MFEEPQLPAAPGVTITENVPGGTWTDVAAVDASVNAVLSGGYVDNFGDILGGLDQQQRPASQLEYISTISAGVTAPPLQSAGVALPVDSSSALFTTLPALKMERNDTATVNPVLVSTIAPEPTLASSREQDSTTGMSSVPASAPPTMGNRNLLESLIGNSANPPVAVSSHTSSAAPALMSPFKDNPYSNSFTAALMGRGHAPNLARRKLQSQFIPVGNNHVAVPLSALAGYTHEETSEDEGTPNHELQAKCPPYYTIIPKRSAAHSHAQQYMKALTSGGPLPGPSTNVPPDRSQDGKSSTGGKEAKRRKFDGEPGVWRHHSQKEEDNTYPPGSWDKPPPKTDVIQCRGVNRKKKTRCRNAALMEYVGPRPLYCAEHINNDPGAKYHKCGYLLNTPDNTRQKKCKEIVYADFKWCYKHIDEWLTKDVMGSGALEKTTKMLATARDLLAQLEKEAAEVRSTDLELFQRKNKIIPKYSSLVKSLKTHHDMLAKDPSQQVLPAETTPSPANSDQPAQPVATNTVSIVPLAQVFSAPTDPPQPCLLPATSGPMAMVTTNVSSPSSVPAPQQTSSMAAPALPTAPTAVALAPAPALAAPNTSAPVVTVAATSSMAAPAAPHTTAAPATMHTAPTPASVAPNTTVPVSTAATSAATKSASTSQAPQQTGPGVRDTLDDHLTEIRLAEEFEGL